MFKAVPNGALWHGDCLDMMREMDPDQVDACVTDPPYGISFMGRGWDHGVPGVEYWQAVLRVLKPGAPLLAFGGTRTHHRLACAIEDAGFEIRDCLMWLYGSGFPKSLNVSKALDKAVGAERDVVGPNPNTAGRTTTMGSGLVGTMRVQDRSSMAPITTASSPEARRWDGYGTALKPAWEPVILARKPLIGTVAANVLEHGVGGLNIDGCRVGTEERLLLDARTQKTPSLFGAMGGSKAIGTTTQGRHPANLILDEEAGALLDEQSGITTSTGGKVRWFSREGDVFGKSETNKLRKNSGGLGDKGGASRFFHCVKTESQGRHPANLILDEEAGALLDEQSGKLRARGNVAPTRTGDGMFSSAGAGSVGIGAGDKGGASRFFYSPKVSKRERGDSRHPTMKPLALMRYLVRLVSPPGGGLILDPFMGSGSTGLAAIAEGQLFVGAELEAESFETAVERMKWTNSKTEAQ